MIFIVLSVYTFIDVSKGSKLSFWWYKSNKSGQILHTGPVISNCIILRWDKDKIGLKRY